MSSAFPTRYSSSSDEHQQKGSSTQLSRMSVVKRGRLQCSEQQRATDDKQSKFGRLSYLPSLPSSSGFRTGWKAASRTPATRRARTRTRPWIFALHHLRLERQHIAVGIAGIRVSIWMLSLPLQKCKSRPLHRANSLPKTDRVSQKSCERRFAVSPKWLKSKQITGNGEIKRVLLARCVRRDQTRRPTFSRRAPRLASSGRSSRNGMECEFHAMLILLFNGVIIDR